MMVSKGKLFWMLSLAMLTAATAGWSAVVKKQIGGVYYNFDTSSRIVTFVTGQGSGTNRTDFKGTTLHVAATMELDGVTYTMGNIGNAFQGCQTLETLTFDSPVKFTEISLWAFAECPKLKSVVVPEGVTTLGADRAFGSCRSLEEATLPTTMKTIGGWSFFDDPALKVIHLKGKTPPSIGSNAFSGSTSCVFTVPDDAYDTYKNASAWKGYTIMKESEYSPNSGKIALMNYLTQNAAAMSEARGGTTPDVYPQDKYDVFAAAKLHADTVCEGEHEEDVYNGALTQLKNAWEVMLSSYNPIRSGYYNIQSAYSAFYTNQKEYKGMTVEGGETLGWASYRDLDPNQAFYVEVLNDGNYHIKSFANGKYIIGATSGDNGATVRLGDTAEREQVISPIGQTQWIIADNIYDKAYHPQNHSNGSGKQGNIVLFNANTVGAHSAWKLIPIHDNVVEALRVAMDAKAKTQELVEVQKEAKALCDSVLRYTMGTSKLITSTSQISSNAQSAAEGTIASLIDGNTTGSPFFHSTYGNPADPGVPHYLQVYLRGGAIKAFKAVLARRSGGYGYADSPKDILISASKDGKEFFDITHYTTTWNSEEVETKTTDLILLGDEYRYIRFTVLRTSQNRCNSGQTHPYFTLSELQMYEAKLDEENSSYFESDAKAEAYRELTELLKKQEDVVSAGVAVQDDIDVLRQAMENLRNPQQKPDTTIPDVRSQTKLVNGSWLAIGNLLGQAGAAAARNYTVYVNERLHFDQIFTRPLGEGKINAAYFSIKQADYYSIELGVTDWAAGTPTGTLSDYIHGTNSGCFAFWYRKLIDLILSINTEAKVVLCTPRKAYGIGEKKPADCYTSVEGNTLEDFARLIRQIAEYEGYPVADFYGNCGGQNDLDGLSSSDTLRPNDEGYQRLANELADAMEKVLRYDSAK